MVLGNKDFVNSFYKRLRTSSENSPNYQGEYKNREEGARKVKQFRGKEGELLYSMRNLQNSAIE